MHVHSAAPRRRPPAARPRPSSEGHRLESCRARYGPAGHESERSGAVRYAIPQCEEMSVARRVFEALILPSVFGLLCGLALGASAALYLIGVVLALAGGIGG